MTTRAMTILRSDSQVSSIIHRLLQHSVNRLALIAFISVASTPSALAQRSDTQRSAVEARIDALTWAVNNLPFGLVLGSSRQTDIPSNTGVVCQNNTCTIGLRVIRRDGATVEYYTEEPGMLMFFSEDGLLQRVRFVARWPPSWRERLSDVPMTMCDTGWNAIIDAVGGESARRVSAHYGNVSQRVRKTDGVMDVGETRIEIAAACGSFTAAASIDAGTYGGAAQVDFTRVLSY